MAVSVKQEVREPLRLVVPPEPTPPRLILPPDEVMGVLGAIALVVAARVLLALSVIGAFVLAFLTVQAPSVGAIVMTSMYAVLVVGPLVYLSLKKG